MIDFFGDMATNPFLITGLCAGVIAGVACGIIGPYVVVRRAVFLAGAIAHIAVGGVGAAIFFRWAMPDAFAWLAPMHGAVIAALIGAAIIALAAEYATERLDTLIGALWAVGMATGLMLVKFTGGYHTELMGYLFGNIALVSWHQVTFAAILLLIVLGAVTLLHKQFTTLCIDEEHAELHGLGRLRLNLALLMLIALVVVCLIQVVGLILMLALLTLPAATAAHWTRRLTTMIVLSTILCVLLATIPRIMVYGIRIGNGALSAEAAIVIAAAAVYLISILASRVRG